MYKGWQEMFGEAGVNIIMVMGEDASQNPAGTGTAASYKAEQSFPDSIPIVADGSWQKTGSAISHPATIGLPFLIVLGGDMEILKIDAVSPADSYLGCRYSCLSFVARRVVQYVPLGYPFAWP